jgi:hypothetical protein
MAKLEAQLRYRKGLASDGIKATLGNENKAVRRKKLTEPAPRPEKAPAQPDIASAGAPRIDFVKRNINGAGDQKSRAKPERVPSYKELIVENRHPPGEIPRYVGSHKASLVSKNVAPQPDRCPPGMRLLTDGEKQESIQELTDQKDEITAKLARLPLTIESPTLLREKKLMEVELDEIEKSIDQLKKKYVFVPDD